MPGVQICRFALADSPRTGMRKIPVRGTPLHFETFFCLHGHLTIKPFGGEPYAVEAPGIFLLSDVTGLSTCLCSRDLCGILIAVDAKAAKESLMTVCAILGMKLDTRIVKGKMATGNCCMAPHSMPIHSFLVRQRLQRAVELIRTTRMPIQQIAQTVWYESMSQFHTAFKRQYGMIPGQYRKMSETTTPRPF